MDYLDCPSLNKLTRGIMVTCDNHSLKKHPVCSIKNALALRLWILGYNAKWEHWSMECLHGGVDEVDGYTSGDENSE